MGSSGALGLRGDFEHGAEIEITSGSTVEIPGGVEDHASVGISASRPSGAEAMQNPLGPSAAAGGRQFEHGTRLTAFRRRPVEIAVSIENQAVARVAASRKVVKHALRPSPAGFWNQLEGRSAGIIAESAAERRSVKIALGIEDQAAVGGHSIPVAAKIVQSRFAPVAARVVRQLKRRAGIVSTAGDGRAIEVTDGVKDQAGVWKEPTRAVRAETIQNSLGPSPAYGGRQLEHRPSIVGTA